MIQVLVPGLGKGRGTGPLRFPSIPAVRATITQTFSAKTPPVPSSLSRPSPHVRYGVGSGRRRPGYCQGTHGARRYPRVFGHYAFKNPIISSLTSIFQLVQIPSPFGFAPGESMTTLSRCNTAPEIDVPFRSGCKSPVVPPAIKTDS